MDTALDWALLGYPAHQGVQRLVARLNRIYASEPCLHREDFQSVLADNRAIVNGLMKVLTSRLRRANHQISTLALLDVYGRVARVIVDMAREEGRRLRDGRIAFRRATHQEISNRIGTTRETVTRMLKDLERHALIKVEGKEIVLQPDFEKAFD